MRILIADRHPEERGSPEQILRGSAHATCVVPDAPALLVAARRASFGAFVMRLSVPLTDDLLVYRTLRSDSRLRDVPVIFCIDGETEPSDAACALAAGAEYVLVEPLERERLLAAVDDIDRAGFEVIPAPRSSPFPARRARDEVAPRRPAAQVSPESPALLLEFGDLLTSLIGHVETLRLELDSRASWRAQSTLDELGRCSARAADLLRRFQSSQVERSS